MTTYSFISQSIEIELKLSVDGNLLTVFDLLLQAELAIGFNLLYVHRKTKFISEKLQKNNRKFKFEKIVNKDILSRSNQMQWDT